MSGVKVTWQQQQNINTYGRLTNRRREIELELAALEEEARTLEDASSEATLCDEGALRVRVGECFVEMEADEAEQLLEAEQGRTKERQKRLAAEMAAAKSTLAELKVELVRHFGDAIALDK